ncbi:hypothetical protein N8295_05635 [Pseudomonadales bacterium]|nr:hypothetical protein [Pseudomonadales bacterium]
MEIAETHLDFSKQTTMWFLEMFAEYLKAGMFDAETAFKSKSNLRRESTKMFQFFKKARYSFLGDRKAEEWLDRVISFDFGAIGFLLDIIYIETEDSFLASLPDVQRRDLPAKMPAVYAILCGYMASEILKLLAKHGVPDEIITGGAQTVTLERKFQANYSDGIDYFADRYVSSRLPHIKGSSNPVDLSNAISKPSSKPEAKPKPKPKPEPEAKPKPKPKPKPEPEAKPKPKPKPKPKQSAREKEAPTEGRRRVGKVKKHEDKEPDKAPALVLIQDPENPLLFEAGNQLSIDTNSWDKLYSFLAEEANRSRLFFEFHCKQFSVGGGTTTVEEGWLFKSEETWRYMFSTVPNTPRRRSAMEKLTSLSGWDYERSARGRAEWNTRLKGRFIKKNGRKLLELIHAHIEVYRLKDPVVLLLRVRDA